MADAPSERSKGVAENGMTDTRPMTSFRRVIKDLDALGLLDSIMDGDALKCSHCKRETRTARGWKEGEVCYTKIHGGMVCLGKMEKVST